MKTFLRGAVIGVASSIALGMIGCVSDADHESPSGADAEIDDGALLPTEPQASIAGEETVAAAEAAAATCAIVVSPPTQLTITDLAVVNDPVRTRWTGSLANPADGAWHFGRLMTQMAGANDPELFVRSWLAQWQSLQIVNGQVVPVRVPDAMSGFRMENILADWPKVKGKLNLAKAPFRLLAIVNRFDLKAPGNAGEGRLVFGVLDKTGAPLQFTVILEYKMLAPTAADVARWAHAWRDLGALARGSAAYRAKLQSITDGFAARNAGKGRPNGSAISQVRSNEIELNGVSWELREFHLTSTGQLRMAPLALTPADDGPRNVDGTARLASYLTQNATAILAQTHVVPLSFGGQPFQGGHVLNQFDSWSAPGITNSTLRHRFSLNTCNGCHGAEATTVADTFLHVNPRVAGQPAKLSGFLTGVSVRDPVTNIPRTFNELAKRATILKAFLCATP